MGCRPVKRMYPVIVNGTPGVSLTEIRLIEVHHSRTAADVRVRHVFSRVEFVRVGKIQRTGMLGRIDVLLVQPLGGRSEGLAVTVTVAGQGGVTRRCRYVFLLKVTTVVWKLVARMSLRPFDICDWWALINIDKIDKHSSVQNVVLWTRHAER